MEEHRQPLPPEDLSGYLDALARVMFQTGISWCLTGDSRVWMAGLEVPAHARMQ